MTNSDSQLFLLDVNVLVALVLPNHPHHTRVSSWFSGVESWATCSITQSGLVRLLLNPLVSEMSLTTQAVLDGLAALTKLKKHTFLKDDADFTEPVIDIARIVGSKQVTDFHLVDLVARHDALLATMDKRLLRSLRPEDANHVHLIEE